jgi:uncharacterized protein YgiM (DUF1202 family)
MYVRILLGFMLIFAVHDVYGQVAKPIKSPTDPYFCNYSKVYNLQDDTYLSVRSGPGMQFSKIDRLKNETVVYVCDEKSDWVQIFYSGPERPCVADSPVGILSTKENTCKSGWAKREWINVIAG